MDLDSPSPAAYGSLHFDGVTVTKMTSGFTFPIPGRERGLAEIVLVVPSLALKTVVGGQEVITTLHNATVVITAEHWNQVLCS